MHRMQRPWELNLPQTKDTLLIKIVQRARKHLKLNEFVDCVKALESAVRRASNKNAHAHSQIQSAILEALREGIKSGTIGDWGLFARSQVLEDIFLTTWQTEWKHAPGAKIYCETGTNTSLICHLLSETKALACDRRDVVSVKEVQETCRDHLSLFRHVRAANIAIEATLMVKLAKILTFLDQHREAKRRLEKAATLFLSVAEWGGAFQALIALVKANAIIFRPGEVERQQNFDHLALAKSIAREKLLRGELVVQALRMQGQENVAFSNAETAFQCFDEAVNEIKAGRVGNVSMRGDLLKSGSLLLAKLHRFEDAIARLTEAMRLAQSANDVKMQIVIGFHLGRAEISAGRYRKSIATLKSTQQNLSGGNVAVADGKIAAALSERLAFALYCNGELKEAMAEAKRARLLAEGNNDLSLSATLLVGNLTSHPTLSVQILKLVRSQLFKRRKKGDLMEEEILSGTSSASVVRGDAFVAPLSESEIQSLCLCGIGIAYMKKYNFRKALKYQRRMQKGAGTQGKYYILSLLNLGCTNALRGDFEKAGVQLASALHLAERGEMPTLQRASLMNLGVCEFFQGRFHDSLATFARVCEMSSHHNHKLAEHFAFRSGVSRHVFESTGGKASRTLSRSRSRSRSRSQSRSRKSLRRHFSQSREGGRARLGGSGGGVEAGAGTRARGQEELLPDLTARDLAAAAAFGTQAQEEGDLLPTSKKYMVLVALPRHHGQPSKFAAPIVIGIGGGVTMSLPGDRAPEKMTGSWKTVYTVLEQGNT